MTASPGVSVPLLLVLVALVSGCGTTNDRAQRTGPPFSESFPDPSVLLRERDVGPLRAKLSRTPLPTTDEHHEKLVETLRGRPEVRAENLLLFTEAVAVWPEGSVQTSVVPVHGSGPFVAYVDSLLVEGGRRLVEFRPAQIGPLVERAQSSDARETIAEILLARCDLSEPEVLDQILQSFTDPRLQSDFVVHTLMDRGLVTGERRWVVLRSLRSPRAMRRVANEVILRDPNFEPGTLATLLRQAETDDARLEFLDLALEWRSFDEPDERSAVLRSFSFDLERYEALERLLEVSTRRPWPPEHWARVAATFSFDSTRLRLILELWGGDRVQDFGAILPAAAWLQVPEERFGLLRRVARRTGLSVEPTDLATAARLFNQDQDRQLVFDNLRRHLSHEPTATEIALILEEFDQGAARLHVLEVFAPGLQLPVVSGDGDEAGGDELEGLDPQLARLLAFFELESLREQARALLVPLGGG